MKSAAALLLLASLMLFGAIVNAQRLINVDAVIAQDPGTGYANGPLRVPPIVQIQKSITGEIYPCPLTVSASLYVDPRWGTSPGAFLIGNTSVTTTTGIATFSTIGVNKEGIGFYLLFTITATVEGTQITWNKGSSAFMVAGNWSTSNSSNGTSGGGGGSAVPGPTPSTTAAPATPRPPSPPPPTPASSAIQIQIDMPSSVPACTTWPTQPKITLINTTNGLTSVTPLSATTALVMPQSTQTITPVSLTGTTSASGTSGVAQFANLAACTAGNGFQLAFNVTFLGVTRTVYSGAFTISGTVPTTSAPASPATPSPPAASVDLSTATLRIVREPGSGVAGAVLRVQPMLRLENFLTGEIIKVSCTAVASLYIPSGFNAATLIGNTTVTGVEGVMEFSNLGVSAAGFGYYIKMTVTAQSQTFVKYTAALFIQSATQAIVDPNGDLVPVAPDAGITTNSPSATPGASGTASQDGRGNGLSNSQLAFIIGFSVGLAFFLAGVTFFVTRYFYLRQLKANESAVGKKSLNDSNVLEEYQLPVAKPRLATQVTASTATKFPATTVSADSGFYNVDMEAGPTHLDRNPITHSMDQHRMEPAAAAAMAQTKVNLENSDGDEPAPTRQQPAEEEFTSFPRRFDAVAGSTSSQSTTVFGPVAVTSKPAAQTFRYIPPTTRASSRQPYAAPPTAAIAAQTQQAQFQLQNIRRFPDYEEVYLDEEENADPSWR